VRIERYTLPELKDKYYQLHDDIFPKDQYHIPSVIYLVFDREYMGFISGYFHDQITFYIQRTAKSNKDFSLKFAQQAFEHLKETEHIRYFLGQIETFNTRAIITSLITGWTINGYFTDTSGKPYVRIIMDVGD